MEFKAGQKVEVDGYTDELWIQDYHVRVCSKGVVVEDTKTYDKKVLITLDDIDGDSNVTVSIRKSKVYV